jgi:hypothetical protein
MANTRLRPAIPALRSLPASPIRVRDMSMFVGYGTSSSSYLIIPSPEKEKES